MPAQDRQQQILQVASQLFIEKGFEHTTMQDVAQQANTTRQTIYTYYKSTDQLLEVLFKQHLSDLKIKLDQQIVYDPAHLPDIKALFQMLLEEKDLLILLNSGTSTTFQVHRQAFVEQLLAGLQPLHDPNHPYLLLLVMQLMEVTAYSVVKQDLTPTQIHSLSRTLELFVKGGIQAVEASGT